MRLFITAACLALFHASAHAQVPALLPVQGHLADASGTPVDGATAMTIRLYASEVAADALYAESQMVNVENGEFIMYAGAVGDLEASFFRDHPTVWLGLTVADDEEISPRFQLGSAPYASFAEHIGEGSRETVEAWCFDTETELLALLDDDYQSASYVPSWAELMSVPAGFADGTDDVGYADESALHAALDDDYLGADYVPSWGDLADVPAEFSDGTDDTGVYQSGDGLSLSSGTFSVDNTVARVTGNATFAGAVHASGFQWSTPRVFVRHIPIWNFSISGLAAGDAYTIHRDGYGYFTAGTWYPTVRLTASPDLPVGAKLTDFECYSMDNDSTHNFFNFNMGFLVRRSDWLGFGSIVSELTTSTGASSSVATHVIGSDIGWTLDESAYAVQVEIANATAASENLRFYGCKLTYELTEIVN